MNQTMGTRPNQVLFIRRNSLAQPPLKMGFSLVELMVVLAIMTTVLMVGIASIQMTPQKFTSQAAQDIANVLRTARNTATRQHRSAVVVIWRSGSTPTESSGQTAGLARAYLSETNDCPVVSPVSGVGPGTPYLSPPFSIVDLGNETGDIHQGAVIARLVPMDDSTLSQSICIRPNGRIIDLVTGRPFAAQSSEHFAGIGEIWTQFSQIQELDGVLVVPRQKITVPYNGIVRLSR
jgi:prepilin-type N-terminal cleavage/methylation domain-containing protein